MSEAEARRICVGVVIGVRGVQGEVRIKSFTEDPMAIGGFRTLTDGTGARQFTLTILGAAKNGLVGRIEGVEDREAAEALKGTELYVDRDRLPAADEDEFYHADLIGLPAEDLEGKPLGTVRRLDNYGAGDVMEITLANGRPLVVPFTDAVVPVIDLGAGRVVVDPPSVLDTGESAREPEEGG